MSGDSVMTRYNSLKEAILRIEELEKENSRLQEELDYFKQRKASGRQKHNDKWLATYKDFVACFESGMTIIEIAQRNSISERTVYRYKAYYDSVKQNEYVWR